MKTTIYINFVSFYVGREILQDYFIKD